MPNAKRSAIPAMRRGWLGKRSPRPFNASGGVQGMQLVYQCGRHPPAQSYSRGSKNQTDEGFLRSPLPLALPGSRHDRAGAVQPQETREEDDQNEDHSPHAAPPFCGLRECEASRRRNQPALSVEPPAGTSLPASFCGTSRPKAVSPPRAPSPIVSTAVEGTIIIEPFWRSPS